MTKVPYIFIVLNILTITHCEDFSNDVFGDKKICCPAAFGHFNSDKLTDVFIIEEEQDGMNVVSVLTSNNSPPLLQPSKAVCKFKDKVISLVPADFDGDGAIDCLAVLSDNSMYKGKILWGNSTGWKCPTDGDYSIKFKSQPLLVDYNGDMIADLFGETENSERVFWVFGFHRTRPKIIPMAGNSTSMMSPSGGHGFVDVDGDLAADLWVVTKDHFELWKSILNFNDFQRVEFPKDASIIGQGTFLDMDLDGSTELLLPFCKSYSCYFYVYEFNDKKWYDLQVNFKDEKETTWKFKKDSSYLYTDTITARAGDYNFDGYPDILITMFDKAGIPKVVLLENAQCTDVSCPYSRTLIPNWELFSEFHTSVMGTFFDFNEDGALDVYLVNVSSSPKKYGVGAFKNPLEFDANFIKVIVLSGNCYQNCSFEQKQHGTNQPGPSMIYTLTTSEGELQKSCDTQMSQSSHSVLQLPFVTFGLGRSWNFVDNLKLGLPIARLATNNYSSLLEPPPIVLESTFSQIIPNSQLVVIPYPIRSPDRWVHKLFITPSQAMLLTAAALIATCIFVAAIIVLLTVLERKEDRRERLQESQRFHFIAM